MPFFVPKYPYTKSKYQICKSSWVSLYNF